MTVKASISDDNIKDDIRKSLELSEMFDALTEEKKNNIAEYLFDTYSHLYKHELPATKK